jgi:hypothetical protein
MRLALTAFLCLVGTSALAGECDRWDASMQEDEGGPVMTAMICAKTNSSEPEAQNLLLVQCASEGSLWMRYIPYASPDNYPPGGDQSYNTEIEFSLDQEMFTEKAQYEDMDGAMAMSTTSDSKLISVMMAQKQVILSDVNDKAPGATFTLNGARKALETIIKACSK